MLKNKINLKDNCKKYTQFYTPMHNLYEFLIVSKVQLFIFIGNQDKDNVH